MSVSGSYGWAYKFSIARRDTITASTRHVLPTGITTAMNFQPPESQRAAVNGDIVLTAEETQKVIQALRHGGISIVDSTTTPSTSNPASSTCTSGPTPSPSPAPSGPP